MPHFLEPYLGGISDQVFFEKYGLDPILWSFASQPEEADIDLIAAHAPTYLCDIDQVNQRVAACGDRGMIRGTVASFAIYGQPGCRQDAAVLYGIAALILET